MARLRLVLAACLAIALPAAPVIGQVEQWAAHIAEASSRFAIPEPWIRRVMRAESGGRTMLNGRPIESPAGAMGLMQLMPGTWRAMRAAHGLGADPHAPRDNILAGTAYLRLMYERFGYPGLFAAYNAGPGAYAAYLAGARRLPAETRAYVAQIASTSAPPGGSGPAPAMPHEARLGPARAPPRPQALFAIRAVQRSGPGTQAAPPRPPRAGGALFVALGADRP